MNIDQAIREDFETRITTVCEPFTSDEIELLLGEMHKIAGRMSVMCNTLLGRPNGLPDGAIQATQNIKVALTQIRCYIDYPERYRRG